MYFENPNKNIKKCIEITLKWLFSDRAYWFTRCLHGFFMIAQCYIQNESMKHQSYQANMEIPELKINKKPTKKTHTHTHTNRLLILKTNHLKKKICGFFFQTKKK